MNNEKDLKLVVFFAYFIMVLAGVGVILPFVIKEPAMKYFGSSAEAIGYAFSFCMTGTIVTTYFNGYLVKFFPIKKILYTISIIYIIFSIVIFFSTSLAFVTFGLFMVGLCLGVMDTTPSFLIIHSFDAASRSSRLNRLDFFFSFGSLLYPLIVSLLLNLHTIYIWQIAYALVGLCFIAIIALARHIPFPDLNKIRQDDAGGPAVQKFSKWNLNILVVSFAMFFYFTSYVGFTYWCVEYLMKKVGISEQSANTSITLFWILYAVGCLVASFALKKIKLHIYIMMSAAVAFVAYLLILASHTTFMVLLFISILGLGSATLYSSLVSYGSEQVKHPSPRLISFLILASAIATNFGETFSSFYVAHFGLTSLVVISSVFMFMVIVCVLWNEKLKKIKLARGLIEN